MSTTIIVSENRTLHVPGPNFYPPLRLDVVAIPPGTPVELPEAEADKLIERGVATQYPPPPPPQPEPNVETADDKLRHESFMALVRAREALAEEALAKDQAAVEQ